VNLYQKIAAVMQDVEYLTKDDTVETGGGKGYRAITEEKVTSIIRASLIKNGIVIVPVKIDHSRTDEKVLAFDKYAKKEVERINRITSVDVTYRIQNTEDAEDFILAVSSGTGVDTQDKGVGKALTYAYKYLLLRTFAIPTGEDPDKISSDVYTSNLTGEKDKPVDTKAAFDDTAAALASTYNTNPDDEIARGTVLRQINSTCKERNITSEALGASCRKTYGKGLNALTTEELQDVLTRLTNNAAQG